jgi:hypothetical protein
MIKRQRTGFEGWLEYIFGGRKDKDKIPFDEKINILTERFAEYLNAMGWEQLKEDTVAIAMFWFLKRFQEKKSNVYVIAEKFGYHLFNTKINVPCSMIKVSALNDYYWIDFPKNMIFQSEDKSIIFNHAVVALTNNPIEKDHNYFHVFASDFTPEGKRLGDTTEIYFPLKSDKNIDDMVLESRQKTTIPDAIPISMVEYIAKCILYIQSGEPDLTIEKAVLPKSKQYHKIKYHYETYSPFDIVKVGYGFHEKMRHTESWEVSGHFRWQRYGQEFSLIKLIWIDAYEKSWKENNRQ